MSPLQSHTKQTKNNKHRVTNSAAAERFARTRLIWANDFHWNSFRFGLLFPPRIQLHIVATPRGAQILSSSIDGLAFVVFRSSSIAFRHVFQTAASQSMKGHLRLTDNGDDKLFHRGEKLFSNEYWNFPSWGRFGIYFCLCSFETCVAIPERKSLISECFCKPNVTSIEWAISWLPWNSSVCHLTACSGGVQSSFHRPRSIPQPLTQLSLALSWQITKLLRRPHKGPLDIVAGS